MPRPTGRPFPTFNIKTAFAFCLFSDSQKSKRRQKRIHCFALIYALHLPSVWSAWKCPTSGWRPENIIIYQTDDNTHITAFLCRNQPPSHNHIRFYPELKTRFCSLSEHYCEPMVNPYCILFIFILLRNH